ncbi:MAG TPA: bacterial transcriptional activator domain-containing protein, partial [Gammaproteobacteria bacterium]|nr:bacterial transcriptional activator domain-containing protein [Gammaproteobacteria bacterium]
LTVEGTHTPDECARLMRRSADALREEGDHEAALALFAATSDWELAADIVRSGAPALLAQGRVQTLHEWIARLPRSHVDASARLLYWEAVCAAQLDPANSAPSIERAYGAFVAAADEAGQALCASLAITANFAEWGNFADRRRWLRILTELLERAPRFSDEIAELRAWAALLFVFSFEVGEFPLGEICADRVAALCRAPLPAGERLAAASQLLFHRNQVASSDAAKEVLNELRPLAESPEASPLQKAGWIWGEATYLFHAGAMTAARRRQAEALQLLAESGLQPMRTVLRLLDIWIVLAESNAALAAEMLDELAPQIDREKPNDVALYQHLRAWLALLEGRPHTAVEHAEQATRITRVHASRSSLVCSFSLAALAFAQCGRMREALEAAAEAVRGSTGAHGVVAFTALLFKCEVLRRCDGAQGELLATLGEAFGTARRSGFVHCLIWIPPLMSRLCAAALAAGIETEHVERLIRVRGLPPPAPDTEIWPWRLRIFTLGRFDVVIDGKRLGFSGKAQRRPLDLLKLLIALGGRKVAVDRLTAMLWPNAEGDAAHRAFKVSLHRLRRLLGVEVLHVESGEVTLDPQCTSVDVWTFERWFGEASARGRAAGETGATATDTVDRVLSLYHGPFLAGDARDWALGARERLRSKYVRGVMLAGDALESRGDDSHAGILYERGIDAEPAAEEIYARLMRCYRRLGRPADALAVYRRCEAMLAALVGTKPSRAVRSLYEEMRESL